MKKIYYLLFILLFTFSCKSGESELFEIDPRKFIENNITLSKIADDITYIPLDNNIPFTNFKYIITPNFLYVSAKGIGILKFSREGKLIKKIGNRGRGPGEFLYGMEFAVNEDNGDVFVLDPGKVFVYSQSGIFLRNIILKEYAGGFGFKDLEFYNSLLFFPDDIPRGDSKYNWVFLDSIGNLVAKKENSVPKFETNIEMQGSIYKFENKLFYYNYFNDTIFSISSDLSYNAEYLFAKGDHRWPKTNIDISSESNFFVQINKFFRPFRMFETKEFIVLHYSYLDKSALSFIEKKTKKSYLAFKFDAIPNSRIKTKACIINDIDGGMPLSDIKYYKENGNEFLTTLINTFEFKDYISGDEFKTIIPKYPNKKKELVKLASNIKETDNPILVLVKLKK
jgi:hypothetical protein